MCMEQALQKQVRRRARGLCEYCLFPESASTLSHVIDHIIARQHGGATTAENLALCCGRCNLQKGPNIAGLDPQTGSLTRLFNPRTDKWSDHFSCTGAFIRGFSSVGRTTVALLAINTPSRLRARKSLIATREFPPASHLR